MAASSVSTRGGLVTIEPGIRVDWNSLTGETAWQPRSARLAAFGRTSVWAGFSTQAQTPSHESLQGFEYFDFSGERDGRPAQRAHAHRSSPAPSAPSAGGIQSPGRGLPSARSIGFSCSVRKPRPSARTRLTRLHHPGGLPSRFRRCSNTGRRSFPRIRGSGGASRRRGAPRRERRRLSRLDRRTRWRSRHAISTAARCPSDFDRRHALNAVVERADLAREVASGGDLAVRLRVSDDADAGGSVVRPRNIRRWHARPALPRVPRPRRQSDHRAAHVFHRRLASINTERTDRLLAGRRARDLPDRQDTGSSTAKSSISSITGTTWRGSTSRPTRRATGDRQVATSTTRSSGWSRSACG